MKTHRKPLLDVNGNPIYVMGGSKGYKDGFSKIKWTEPEKRAYKVKVNGKVIT